MKAVLRAKCAKFLPNKPNRVRTIDAFSLVLVLFIDYNTCYFVLQLRPGRTKLRGRPYYYVGAGVCCIDLCYHTLVVVVVAVVVEATELGGFLSFVRINSGTQDTKDERFP